MEIDIAKAEARDRAGYGSQNDNKVFVTVFKIQAALFDAAYFKFRCQKTGHKTINGSATHRVTIEAFEACKPAGKPTDFCFSLPSDTVIWKANQASPIKLTAVFENKKLISLR
ncbi:MAG: hypothetical protein JSS79_05135 [Bacteroidetes bacterium]|nr:hypothetical protein [Bacteroidota bacterium]